MGSTFTMASELGFLARSFTVFRYTNKSFNVEAKHVQHFKKLYYKSEKTLKIKFVSGKQKISQP